MRLRPPTATYDNLIVHMRREGDPLNPSSEGSSDRDGLVDLVPRLLRGADADTAARIAAQLSKLYARSLRMRSRKDVPDQRLRGAGAVDRVTAAILAHMGVDPLVVAWLVRVSNGFGIVDDATGQDLGYLCNDVRPGRMDSTSSMQLGPTAFWHGEGSIGVDAATFPETVATSCRGRPLRTVFSHPALDALDLTIIETSECNGCFWFVVDADMQALSPGDLVAAFPRSSTTQASS